ncbi:hypothetical protein BXA50_16395, partial [Enterococcus faecium]
MIDRAKGRKGVDFMEVKQLPKREELPENLTWDLTKIFSSDQEFDEKYLELSEELKQSEKHKGTL